MKLIDKIFKNLGYFRMIKEIPIKVEEFKIETVMMNYNIDQRKYGATTLSDLLHEIEQHYTKEKEFLQSIRPFIMKRQHSIYPLKTNQQDNQIYELCIFIAKPINLNYENQKRTDN